ncbi:MAG TPA: hypothetical protein VF516_46245, partial [Kofleriaceae bacterium]
MARWNNANARLRHSRSPGHGAPFQIAHPSWDRGRTRSALVPGSSPQDRLAHPGLRVMVRQQHRRGSMANTELRGGGVQQDSLLERVTHQLTTTARGDRVARTIGWTAIALGASHLLMPSAVARWLAPGGRGALVRLLGAAELAS